MSFDITDITEELPRWLTALKERFALAQEEQPDQYQPLKVLLEPTQQQIGDRVYEVAFIADADGLPLEFIRVLSSKL